MNLPIIFTISARTLLCNLLQLFFHRLLLLRLQVHPILWILACLFTFGFHVALLYWLYMWGAYMGNNNVSKWGVFFGISTCQDVCCVEFVKCFLLTVAALSSARPQLRAIRRVINDICMQVVPSTHPIDTSYRHTLSTHAFFYNTIISRPLLTPSSRTHYNMTWHNMTAPPRRRKPIDRCMRGATFVPHTSCCPFPWTTKSTSSRHPSSGHRCACTGITHTLSTTHMHTHSIFKHTSSTNTQTHTNTPYQSSTHTFYRQLIHLINDIDLPTLSTHPRTSRSHQPLCSCHYEHTTMVPGLLWKSQQILGRGDLFLHCYSSAIEPIEPLRYGPGESSLHICWCQSTLRIFIFF